MNEALDRLISAARKACEKVPLSSEEAPSCEAPIGFGTRVAAAWRRSHPDTTVLFERLAWRGLAFALVICLFTAIMQETVVASSQDYSYAEAMAMPGEELF